MYYQENEDIKMILIIHDLSDTEFEKLNLKITNAVIVSNNNKIKKCLGCFGCWTKSPTTCLIKDGYENNSTLFKDAEKVIIISQNYYGMFSPFVKNVFDRSISYVMPYFCKAYNETHHIKRYNKKLELDYLIYGDITELEKNTFIKLCRANQENLDSTYNLNFYPSIGDIIYE